MTAKQAQVRTSGGYPIDAETGLTELETEFVRQYVISGGKKQESAISAGYSKESAHTRAWELLRKPKVINAIANYRRKMYQQDATEYRVILKDIMLDKSVSATVKKDIGLAIMDRAGDKMPEVLEIADKRSPKEIRSKLDLLLDDDNVGHTDNIPTKH